MTAPAMTAELAGPEVPAEPAGWLERVAAGLAASGLPGRLGEAAGEAYLCVPLSRRGCRDAEVIVDGDGYCEVRWWLPRAAGPAEAAAVVTAVLGAAHTRAVPGLAGS